MVKQKKQMTIAEQAFAYHAQGYSIMPVKQDKRPMLAKWKPYQTIPATDEEVLKWFPKIGTPNIGIITGKISGITVIDIDNKVSQEQTDQMLIKFSPTLTIITPSGGYHLYYKYQEGLTISANAYPQFPNVDIRGDTGYVVAPPSITPKGKYEVVKNLPLAPFPIHLFGTGKPKKTLEEKLTAKKGARNDTVASLVGQLLQAEQDQDKWYSDVLPAVQRINKGYPAPLADNEVLTVFNSIAKKERRRRENLGIVSTEEDGTKTTINLSRNKSNTPYANMSNVVSILEAHASFREKIRYNLFRQEIELNGLPLEDNDIVKIQYTLQTECGLPTIQKEAVFSALVHCAYHNRYDEAQDWLKSLKWDGEERLFTWLTSATGVEDNEYHRGIGTQ